MVRMVSSTGRGSFRFPASSSALTFLSDSFSGATVLLSLTRESSAYHGDALVVSRSNGSASTRIGYVGNALDLAALNAYLVGGTAFVDTWFDQSGNGNDANQGTQAKRWQIILDTDGLPSLIGGDGLGMEVADNATHKTAKIELFMVSKIGATFNNSTNYDSVMAAWMATSSTTAESQSRWGFVLSEGGFGDGLELVKNATAKSRTGTSLPASIPLGNGYRTKFHTWNYSSEKLVVRRNGVTLWDDNAINGTAAADVTYSGTGKLYIGNNAAYTQCGAASVRAVVIYGTTRADNVAISSYLQTRFGTSENPTTYSTGDGWLWTPDYNSTFVTDSSDDVNGLRWTREHGAYRDDGVRGPSMAFASNVSNGASYMRMAVGVNDNDTVVTGAERAEREGLIGGVTTIAKGDDFERFAQFYIEAGSPQIGNWADIFQIHYAGGASPDICFLSVQGNQTPGNGADLFQVATQRNGSETNRGSGVGYSRGVWYAARWKGFWSSGGSSDTLQVWLGANGGTLTQIVNVSGSLFSTDATGAYIKQGIYRGFPTNNPGILAVRFANEQFSKTAGAFAAFVTSQPALPTHS